MASEIIVTRCGVRFDSPAIVILYTTSAGGSKVHRRTMPLRGFSKASNLTQVAEELKNNKRHEKYLESLPTAQLIKLISMIQDKLSGRSHDEIIKKAKSVNMIDPEEDLNKVDESTLIVKKAIMDQTFEKHQIKPDDPDFKYDNEVEFTGPLETCEWDKEESDEGF